METAANSFANDIEAQPFKTAKMPVVCNVNAQPTTDDDALKANLKNQMCSGVQWTNTLTSLVETLGVQAVIEFGPGKVLTGLVKKQYPEVECLNVFDLPSLEATVAWVQAQASSGASTTKPHSLLSV